MLIDVVDDIVERCLHAHPTALVDDVAVEVIDLGAPATHHILEHRRRPPASPLALAAMSAATGLSRGRSRVNEALGVNAVDQLDLDPHPRPTMIASAASWIAMRAGPGHAADLCRAEATSPAIGFAMQFTVSFERRSPQRLVVTLASATSFITPANRWARSLSCRPARQS